MPATEVLSEHAPFLKPFNRKQLGTIREPLSWSKAGKIKFMDINKQDRINIHAKSQNRTKHNGTEQNRTG